ncbi:MAG: hypothetical protein LUG57_02465 [Oscillospiraceae bacterium]|nr:hypothetical protein [Oscillospiraceae bacterium]
MEKQAKTKKTSSKKTFALIRALVAVLLAVILLAASGLAVINLLAGPTEVTDGSALTAGQYVQIDVSYVMDIIGAENDASGNPVAYYAVTPVGNQFVAIRFPASQYDEFAQLTTETNNYLTGTSSAMSYHIIVSGQTTDNITTVDRLLTQWYDSNSEWMISAGVIAEVSDGYTYLSAVTVQADRVGSVSYGAAIALTIIAALLIVYAVVELALILAGVYNPDYRKKAQKAKAPKEKKEPAPQPASEPVKTEAEAPAAPEPSAEEPAEPEPAQPAESAGEDAGENV